MERDVGRGQSGDQAAWQDLVARLESPTPVDPALAPWPDRENLSHAPSAPPGAASPPEKAGQAGPVDVDTVDVDTVDPPGQPGPPEGPADLRPGRGHAPGNRSRVIRPASFLRFSSPPMVPPIPGTGDGQEKPGRPGSAGQAANGAGPESCGPGELDELSGFDDLDESGGYDDLDDRYIPPPVPPQPKLDPVAKGAWTALFGGPGYLFIGTLLNWQFPAWAEFAAITAFVVGLVVLVFRLGDGPSRRDGPDQGAVV